MTKIVFLDTETTSLRPDRRAWDIALIVREPGQADREYTWFVDLDDLDLANADPKALDIGRFYDRHPAYRPAVDTTPDPDVWAGFGLHEAVALRDVQYLTRGAHLVGMVPSFDADVLGTRMRAHGLLPGWHHHLVDVGTLAFAYTFARSGAFPRLESGVADALPWSTTLLGENLGVPTPPDADRHTAIGDARYVRALFDDMFPRGPIVCPHPWHSTSVGDEPVEPTCPACGDKAFAGPAAGTQVTG